MSLTDLPTPSQTMQRLGLWIIFPLFMDRFVRSLRFCCIKFVKEAISDGWRIFNLASVVLLTFILISSMFEHIFLYDLKQLRFY